MIDNKTKLLGCVWIFSLWSAGVEFPLADEDKELLYFGDFILTSASPIVKTKRFFKDGTAESKVQCTSTKKLVKITNTNNLKLIQALYHGASHGSDQELNGTCFIAIANDKPVFLILMDKTLYYAKLANQSSGIADANLTYASQTDSEQSCEQFIQQTCDKVEFDHQTASLLNGFSQWSIDSNAQHNKLKNHIFYGDTAVEALNKSLASSKTIESIKIDEIAQIKPCMIFNPTTKKPDKDFILAITKEGLIAQTLFIKETPQKSKECFSALIHFCINPDGTIGHDQQHIKLSGMISGREFRMMEQVSVVIGC